LGKATRRAGELGKQLTSVAKACALAYELEGEIARVSDTLADAHMIRVVAVPSRRRIEAIVPDVTLSRGSIAQIRRDRAAGVEVWLLVPFAELGRAQEKYRGEVDCLQSWWFDNDRVLFGAPRIP
jgi:hypothetical protein